jgi:hypothetical protein
MNGYVEAGYVVVLGTLGTYGVTLVARERSARRRVGAGSNKARNAAGVGAPAPAGVGAPAPAGAGTPAPAGAGTPAPAGAGTLVPQGDASAREHRAVEEEGPGSTPRAMSP